MSHTCAKSPTHDLLREQAPTDELSKGTRQRWESIELMRQKPLDKWSASDMVIAEEIDAILSSAGSVIGRCDKTGKLNITREDMVADMD